MAGDCFTDLCVYADICSFMKRICKVTKTDMPIIRRVFTVEDRRGSILTRLSGKGNRTFHQMVVVIEQ